MGSRAKAALALAAIALVALVAVASSIAMRAQMRAAMAVEEPPRGSIGETYTHDGQVIRWYVFADPGTGQQYLVNDLGGCVKREG